MRDRQAGAAVEEGGGADARLLLGLSAARIRTHLLAAYLVLIPLFLVVSIPRALGATGYVAGQLVWLSVALALLWSAWIAFRSSPTPVERRFWGFLFAAAACVVASQMLYIGDIVYSGPAGPSLSSLSTVFDGLTVVVLVALLTTLTRFRQATWAARLRFIVDILAACIVFIGVLDDLIVGPAFDVSNSGSLPAVLYSAYPVVGAIVLIGTLRVVIGTRYDRWQPWERRIGGAAGAFALGLLLSPLGYSDVAARATHGWASIVVDGVLLSSLWLGFSAVVHRVASRERPWRLRPVANLEPSYGWIASVVLPSIELLAIPVFGIAAFQTADPAERAFRLVIVGVVSVLLALRTLLAVADSEALLARADADPLTGLLNHRLFHHHLGGELERATRHGESVGLVALDIDDFGAVNSVGGHLAGDSALVAIARVVETAVRGQDIVCRVGGDELMVILPGADLGSSFVTARRILDGVRTVLDSAGRPISASAGVAAYPEHAADREHLVAAADAALYWAKRHGKDRAVLYDMHVVAPLSPEQRIRDLRDHANLEAVRALAAAVDARDPGTQDHSRNVSAIASTLARELGMDEGQVMHIGFAGLLHDVGKIGVPDSVLHKKGPLTPEERGRLSEHASLGAQILASTAMGDIPPWVRHHHERWDGSGFPDGLAGEDIPLGARIVALAEAYDSLVSGRPGRKPLTPRAALQQIDLELGATYDPLIGERFIRMMTAQALSLVDDRGAQ